MNENVEYKGYTIKILQDELGGDCRDWDNLGKMVCFHTRYDLGDKHDFRLSDFSGWDELQDALVNDEEAEIILPLYLYDHSGISMRCSRNSGNPFLGRAQHAAWDSMMVGFIYATRQDILKEYDKKRISPMLRERVTRLLEGEVKAYNDELTGNIWGYIVEDPDGEHVDSCWGFYGSEGIEQAMEDAKSIIDYEIREANDKAWMNTNLIPVGAE